MYIPKHFKLEDEQQAIAFMQRYSFATFINVQNNLAAATHLPFLVKQQGGNLIISSHFARANPQAAHLTENQALVIFTEPHAYISPQHYEKEQSVPTWNYIAIHAYGQAEIIDGDEEQFAVLEEMIAAYDTAYLQQWNALPMDFKLKMLKGIVAFKITVTDLQAKSKLSQNRSEQERANIIASLKNSSHHTEKEIADYMAGLKK